MRLHIRSIFIVGVLIVSDLCPTLAHAQVIVFDPGVLIQLVRIVSQAETQYDEVVAQRRLWRKLAMALPAGRQMLYLIPETPWSMTRGSDDLDLFNTYVPLRRAIESGDPTGLQWRRTVVPLATYPPSLLAQLPPEQRLDIAREYTHPLTSDGLGIMAVHALAYNRDGHQAASRALDQLTDRLRAGDHGNIAIHQELAGTELLAVREEHLRNVYLAYLLEGEVADLKRVRDTEARRLNTDIVRRTVGASMTTQTTAGMDDVLTNFWTRIAR
jgi:hypothetical protein